MNLFLSNLSIKTNLAKELTQIKSSMLSLNLNKILSKLENVSENNLTKSLFNEIENDIKRAKKGKEEKFNFIFPLNIIYKEGLDHWLQINGLTFEDILNLFEIELVKPSDYKFKNTEISMGDFKDSKKRIKELMDVLTNHEEFFGLLLEINILSRDIEYARQMAKKRIKIFAGFLSLITYYLHTPRLYSSRINKDQKLEITNISTDSFLVFRNKEELLTPIYFLINGKGQKILLEDEIWQNQKDETFKEIKDLSLVSLDDCDFPLLKEIVKVYDKKNLNLSLKTILDDGLELYYDACKEQMIDYSFLKFWMISELILKKSGKLTDKTVTNRMIQVLKSIVRLPTEKFLSEEIYFMQKKRNDLVHEGQIDRISQYDRNMAKLIADSLFKIFIEWIPYLDDINGLSFVLENIRQSYDNLDQYSRILDKLKTPNELTIRSALTVLKNHQYEIEFSTFIKELREVLRVDNDAVMDKIQKKLLNGGWISLNNERITPNNKILIKYDMDIKFLIKRYPLI
jgi:hypothetical protein